MNSFFEWNDIHKRDVVLYLHDISGWYKGFWHHKWVSLFVSQLTGSKPKRRNSYSSMREWSRSGKNGTNTRIWLQRFHLCSLISHEAVKLAVLDALKEQPIPRTHNNQTKQGDLWSGHQSQKIDMEKAHSRLWKVVKNHSTLSLSNSTANQPQTTKQTLWHACRRVSYFTYFSPPMMSQLHWVRHLGLYGILATLLIW